METKFVMAEPDFSVEPTKGVLCVDSAFLICKRKNVPSLPSHIKGLQWTEANLHFLRVVIKSDPEWYADLQEFINK